MGGEGVVGVYDELFLLLRFTPLVDRLLGERKGGIEVELVRVGSVELAVVLKVVNFSAPVVASRHNQGGGRRSLGGRCDPPYRL